MYNKVVEECFFNPKHVGSLDQAKPNTAYFSVNTNEALIALYLEYNAKRVIKRACFKARANPYVISALEWVCRQLEGRSLEELPQITYQRLVDVLEIPPDKYPAAVQVDRVYKELIKRCQ